MTRTGMSPRLALYIAEPFVEIHPADAAPLGLEHGALARIETAHGAAVLRVMASANQQRGSLFVPIHWSGWNSSQARVSAAVQPITDQVSGQPEAKATPARIVPLPMRHYGFVLARERIDISRMTYWARAPMASGHATFFALEESPESWDEFVSELFGRKPERLSYKDAGTQQFRAALLDGGRLEAVLYAAASPALPSIEWLKSCFDLPAIAGKDRRSLLAGRPLGGGDDGPIVCACFQVGRTRIEGAIADGACSAAEIGIATRAGTNCGSCLPELKRIASASVKPLAEAAE
jgi:assimilatory nitrate reductase catalytic subunit